MIRLYSSLLSPNTKRVRVIAAELGLDVEVKAVDLQKGENKTPEFLAMNPNGKVPTVEKNGRSLWESPAVLYELASERPESGLVPSGVAERAEMLRWMFWNASHLEPAIFGVAFETWFKAKLMGQAADGARVEENMRNFARYAPVLNDRLTGRRWVLGDRFTIADIALGTSVEVTKAAEIPLAPYPSVARWLDRVAARPSWKA